MEVYRTNRESRPCACGGKSAMTPSMRLTHLKTLKHREWRWRCLCEAMLDLTLSRDAKITMLKEMKELVPYASP